MYGPQRAMLNETLLLQIPAFRRLEVSHTLPVHLHFEASLGSDLPKLLLWVFGAQLMCFLATLCVKETWETGQQSALHWPTSAIITKARSNPSPLSHRDTLAPTMPGTLEAGLL